MAACSSDDGESAQTSAPSAPDTTVAATDSVVSETTEATATTEATETTEAPAGNGMPTCAATQGAVVGYSEPLPDPNFALIEDVLSTQLSAAGAELVAVNAQLDPGKQLADIQTLQQQGIDVLLINPVAPEPVAAVLQELMAAGTPVIVQDTSNDGTYTSSVIADVESAAKAGAELLKELVGDGSVGAIIGPPFAEVLVRQAEAFTAAAEAAGLNVIDVQTNQNPGSPDGARAIAEAWKQQNPDLAGIWTFNDTSATGVASAFDDSFAPALVSINGQPEAIPLIEAGRINATFDLQQDLIARGLAFAALSAICGVELPDAIYIGTEIIDADNVAAWVNPADRGREDRIVELQEIDGRSFLVQV